MKLPSEATGDVQHEEIDWESVQRELIVDNSELEKREIEDFQEKEREKQGYFKFFKENKINL